MEVTDLLSITSLDGQGIRSWSLKEAGEGMRNLIVDLSRPQDSDYRLRIRAEAGVDKLPAEVEVPAIAPTGGIRASGHLVVGTDSALQLPCTMQRRTPATTSTSLARPRRSTL